MTMGEQIKEVTGAGETTGPGAGLTAGQRFLGFLRNNLHNIGLPVAVLILVVVLAVASELFLTSRNLRNVGLQASALAAIAFGQTVVILTGGLDLSVGAIVALVSVVTGMGMVQFGVPIGLCIGILAGVAVGLVNGILVTRFRVFPFIATLAMMSVITGLALKISNGTPIAGLPTEFTLIASTRIWGVPLPLIIALALFTLVFSFLRYTRIGRNIYAVGGNRQAAHLAGLNTRTIVTIAYAISAFCAAIGSIILSARVGSGQPTLGSTLPLESVAAVVLGGVSLFGGRGSVVNVAFGVAFMSILSNGLNLLNVSSYTQMMVIGGALIVAVALDQKFVLRR
jgi:ribose transport system permease protein